MMAAHGLASTQSGFALPQLENPSEEFNLTKEEGSWFASIFIIGFIFGSVAGSLESKMLGRKKTIWINSISYIIVNFVLASCSNLTILLLTRFLLGMVSTSATIALLMYCGEITQAKVRQITGSFSGFFFAFGCVIGLTLGAILPWRWAFAVGNIVPICCAVCMILTLQKCRRRRKILEL